MELALQNIFLLITIFPALALAYSSGKVQPACSTMIPGHQRQPQTTPALYSLTFRSTNHTGKLAIEVTLSKQPNGGDFKGFMIQARAPNGSIALGTFVVQTQDVQTLTCGTPDSAVSHTSASLKSSVVVIWIPPNTKTDIQFRATVVASFDTIWTDVLSVLLPRVSAGSQLMIPTLFQLLVCSFTLIIALVK